MTKDEPSPLVAAAQALDRELASFAELAAALRHERFGSQKSLDRGAQLLRQVGDTDGRLAEALAGLVHAIDRAREAQAAQAEDVRARAVELDQRGESLRELLGQYQALGEVAGRVSQTMLAVTEGDLAARPDAVASLLPDLTASIATAAEAGKALAASAEARAFPDVARNAETLRQQLLAAHNKMVLLQKRLDTAH
jgi:hypothetical protein